MLVIVFWGTAVFTMAGSIRGNVLLDSCHENGTQFFFEVNRKQSFTETLDFPQHQ